MTNPTIIARYWLHLINLRFVRSWCQIIYVALSTTIVRFPIRLMILTVINTSCPSINSSYLSLTSSERSLSSEHSLRVYKNFVLKRVMTTNESDQTITLRLSGYRDLRNFVNLHTYSFSTMFFRTVFLLTNITSGNRNTLRYISCPFHSYYDPMRKYSTIRMKSIVIRVLYSIIIIYMYYSTVDVEVLYVNILY